MERMEYSQKYTKLTQYFTLHTDIDNANANANIQLDDDQLAFINLLQNLLSFGES